MHLFRFLFGFVAAGLMSLIAGGIARADLLENPPDFPVEIRAEIFKNHVIDYVALRLGRGVQDAIWSKSSPEVFQDYEAESPSRDRTKVGVKILSASQVDAAIWNVWQVKATAEDAATKEKVDITITVTFTYKRDEYKNPSTPPSCRDLKEPSGCNGILFEYHLDGFLATKYSMEPRFYVPHGLLTLGHGWSFMPR